MNHFMQTGIWMVAGTASVRVPAAPAHAPPELTSGTKGNVVWNWQLKARSGWERE